jgi:hypothetical protein
VSEERALIFIELVVIDTPCWRRTLARWGARAFVYAAAATARREGHVERPTASVELDGQGTTQDLVAFTSSDEKFRTRMCKAGPEHHEYKSG